MSDFGTRIKKVRQLVASEAVKLPLRASGLWYHHDLRDNVYLASHVLAAESAQVTDESLAASLAAQLAGSPTKAVSREVAERVMADCLRLQDRNPTSELYGHWPIQLDPVPAEAKPNRLTAELLGCLVFYVLACEPFRIEGSALREELEQSAAHLYASNAFRNKPLEYNHHSAKHTALQLLMGLRYHDEELRGQGLSGVRALLERTEQYGFREYGSLPWFWHWVLAYDMAWQAAKRYGDREVEAVLEAMLEHLWKHRAESYLKGAWAGAHSRTLPNDVPADRNGVYDYVQFGDFPLPRTAVRPEAVGCLMFDVGEEVRRQAVDRREPVLHQHTIYHPERQPVHLYTYMTERYAIGGAWEYVEEFLNEQHRWDVTFPVQTDGSANQLFFFHPGKGYTTGSMRFQSGYSEVLYHRHAVAALYRIPDTDPNPFIVGCLPNGNWEFGANYILGTVQGGVGVAIRLSGSYIVTEREHNMEIRCEGRSIAVVVEVAEGSQVTAVSPFTFDGSLLEYRCSSSGDVLQLGWSAADGGVHRSINGAGISF